MSSQFNRHPFSVPVFAALTAAVYFSAANAHATTLGHDLVNRSFHDGANGSIFLLDEEGAAGTVTTFGFYDDNFAGRDITPVILKATGTGFEITGIGTTRTSDASGAQTHSFGLVSGSAQMGLGYAVGWKDGSNGANNPGVPEFDNGGGGEIAWSGAGQTSFSIGDFNAFASRFARTYSFQATTDDEPGEIVGNIIGNRGSNNGANGSIFILNDPFTEGGFVDTWAMYDDDDFSNPNRQVTPLLLKPVGSSWEIIGIGTTRQSNESGAQYFDFDLVAGTDDVGPGVYFGWKDGSNGANNSGVIDFDTVTGGPEIIWLGGGRTSFSVGDSFGESGRFDRTYSIQAFAVPEPTTALLGLLGAGALLRPRRCRTA